MANCLSESGKKASWKQLERFQYTLQEQAKETGKFTLLTDEPLWFGALADNTMSFCKNYINLPVSAIMWELQENNNCKQDTP